MPTHWAILSVPGLPLLAAVLTGLLGPRVLRGQSHWPAICGVAGALASAAYLLFCGPPRSVGTLYVWFQGARFSVHVGYLLDPLAAVMLVTVTSVSLLVAVYSRGYMKSHRGYARFFAFLSLFVFAMCTLVLADNFLLLFFGWEAVGLCSYLLIGFYYDRPSAADAARKAFVVNRVADFGFLLGVLLIWVTFGSLSYSGVLDPSAWPRSEVFGFDSIRVIALLLFCGAMGKSAQLLLHVWLPDAMEGPAPASALMYAATMVTAGVYMVARAMPLFEASGVLPVVAVVGAATALVAATIALVKADLKRVLAYSTISQLGYMFLGLGMGAGSAAVFHLFTHAFFKALLFLGAGAVMHSLAGAPNRSSLRLGTPGALDIRRMGGLGRSLPVTAVTFLVACLALAGVPGTAGFFSKDEIIAAAFAGGRLGHVLGWVGTATAALTAFYTFRLFMRVFTGPRVLPEESGGHVHRPSAWMWGVLGVLAAPSLLGGYLGGWLHGRLDGLLGPAPHVHWAAWASGGFAVGGAALAIVLYGPLRGWATHSGIDRTVVHRLLWNSYYIDELYGLLIVGPVRRLGRVCTWIDDHGIDNLLLAVTWAPRGLGRALRTAQRSSLGGYALAFAVGAVLLTVVLMMLR